MGLKNFKKSPAFLLWQMLEGCRYLLEAWQTPVVCLFVYLFVYLFILGRKLNRQNCLLKEVLREREEKEEKEKKKSN